MRMDDSLSSEERMAPSDYRLFAAIVAEGSLAAAGRRLGISAPMASKRLARLEARLGARLVHRTTRTLALTERGVRFHADVLAILAAIADAERRAAGRPDRPAGPLRITAPTSFGRLHVAPQLGAFLDRHPAIAVTLNLSDGFTDLLAERTDLAIRITAAVDPGLVAERLGTSRRILCAAPAYLAAHGMPATVRDLARHRLLAAEGQLPWRLSGPARPVVVDGVSTVRTNSSEVVRELALAGVGIALRSLWDVGPDLAAGRLLRLLPDHAGSADVGIYAVQPRAALVPAAVTAFVAHLRTTFLPVPPWDR